MHVTNLCEFVQTSLLINLYLCVLALFNLSHGRAFLLAVLKELIRIGLLWKLNFHVEYLVQYTCYMHVT